MAIALTQFFDPYHVSVVVVTGITGAGTTPSFRSRTLVAGSFVVSGTWATSVSCSVQLQGSNDNTNFVNIGVPLVASSGTVAQAGSISPEGFFFSHYQWVITGGDGGTALSINARLAELGV